jgi:hypothetical protein
LAWFCFLFPLIEPDWQISRIRDNIVQVVETPGGKTLSQTA